jgi:predicted nucleic acid-binding protein
VTEYVVDSSALVEALTGKAEPATALRVRLENAVRHVPHLIDAELGHVLRKRVISGVTALAEAVTARRAAGDIVNSRYPHTGWLGDAAWDLRGNFTFYDALYVALATRLQLSLLTTGGRLANAPKLICAVELV